MHNKTQHDFELIGHPEELNDAEFELADWFRGPKTIYQSIRDSRILDVEGRYQVIKSEHEVEEDRKIAESEDTPESRQQHNKIESWHIKTYTRARLSSVFRHLAHGRLQAMARENDLSAPKLVKIATWSEDCRLDPENRHVIFPSGDWLYDVMIDLPPKTRHPEEVQQSDQTKQLPEERVPKEEQPSKRAFDSIRQRKLTDRLKKVVENFENLPYGTRQNSRGSAAELISARKDEGFGEETLRKIFDGKYPPIIARGIRRPSKMHR